MNIGALYSPAHPFRQPDQGVRSTSGSFIAESRSATRGCGWVLIAVALGAPACSASRFTAHGDDSNGETSQPDVSASEGAQSTDGSLDASVPVETGASSSAPWSAPSREDAGRAPGSSSEASASGEGSYPSPASTITEVTQPYVSDSGSAQPTEFDSGTTPPSSAGASSSETMVATEGSSAQSSSHGPSRDGGSTEESVDSSAFDAGSSDSGASTTEPPFVDQDFPAEPGSCSSGEFDEPRVVLGLGYSDRLWGPAISADGQTLYFGYTGSNEDLYRATLARDRDRTFGNVTGLTNLNRTSNEGTPFLSYDGRTLYFYSDRAGGAGGRDLWQATRSSSSAPFGDVSRVLGVSAESYDHLPWLSDSERTIYFTTERAGGLGRSDIWVATRNSKADSFTNLRRMPGINSEAREDAVAFSPDRLTVYFTTDRNDPGNLDIWRATRSSLTDEFANPEPVPALNSGAEDTNLAMTRDGKRLYFSSGREGGQRIWVAMRSCP